MFHSTERCIINDLRNAKTTVCFVIYFSSNMYLTSTTIVQKAFMGVLAPYFVSMTDYPHTERTDIEISDTRSGARFVIEVVSDYMRVYCPPYTGYADDVYALFKHVCREVDDSAWLVTETRIIEAEEVLAAKTGS